MELSSPGWQLQTKSCTYGFACSSYVKFVSAAGAAEIITMIQRPKRRCSSILWSMESMTRHNRSHGQPLHPGLAPAVLTLSCCHLNQQHSRIGLVIVSNDRRTNEHCDYLAILLLFVHLFDMCLFGFVGFLFLLVSGKGCGL